MENNGGKWDVFSPYYSTIMEQMVQKQEKGRGVCVFIDASRNEERRLGFEQ